MDITAFEGSPSKGGGEPSLADIVALLDEDLQYPVKATVAVIKHGTKLVILVVALGMCVVIYCFAVSWLCMFWLQTRMLFLASAILRSCMDEPTTLVETVDQQTQIEATLPTTTEAPQDITAPQSQSDILEALMKQEGELVTDINNAAIAMDTISDDFSGEQTKEQQHETFTSATSEDEKPSDDEFIEHEPQDQHDTTAFAPSTRPSSHNITATSPAVQMPEMTTHQQQAPNKHGGMSNITFGTTDLHIKSYADAAATTSSGEHDHREATTSQKNTFNFTAEQMQEAMQFAADVTHAGERKRPYGTVRRPHQPTSRPVGAASKPVAVKPAATKPSMSNSARKTSAPIPTVVTGSTTTPAWSEMSKALGQDAPSPVSRATWTSPAPAGEPASLPPHVRKVLEVKRKREESSESANSTEEPVMKKTESEAPPVLAPTAEEEDDVVEAPPAPAAAAPPVPDTITGEPVQAADEVAEPESLPEQQFESGNVDAPQHPARKVLPPEWLKAINTTGRQKPESGHDSQCNHCHRWSATDQVTDDAREAGLCTPCSRVYERMQDEEHTMFNELLQPSRRPSKLEEGSSTTAATARNDSTQAIMQHAVRSLTEQANAKLGIKSTTTAEQPPVVNVPVNTSTADEVTRHTPGETLLSNGNAATTASGNRTLQASSEQTAGDLIDFGSNDKTSWSLTGSPQTQASASSLAATALPFFAPKSDREVDTQSSIGTPPGLGPRPTYQPGHPEPAALRRLLAPSFMFGPPGLGAAQADRLAQCEAVLPEPLPEAKALSTLDKENAQAQLKFKQIGGLKGFQPEFKFSGVNAPSTLDSAPHVNTSEDPNSNQVTHDEAVSTAVPDTAPEANPVSGDVSADDTMLETGLTQDTKPTKRELREQRSSAREALKEAWLDREEARKRVLGHWTSNRTTALQQASHRYLQKRDELKALMADGELHDDDVKWFPNITNIDDLTPPKHTPPGLQQIRDRKQQEASASSSDDDARATSSSASAPPQPVNELEELKKKVRTAWKLLEEAKAYFRQGQPQSNISYASWKKKGDGKLDRATKHYKKKRADLDAHFTITGMPADLAIEFPEIL